MIWFTSDTHFGHLRTLQLHKRPFKTVKEMESVIIENWDELVSPTDTVYHLGDFGDYSKREYLNGEIILIRGNYDTDIPDGLFSSVVDSLVFEDMHLNHYPSKHKEGMFNLFGHVHKLCMVKRYGLNVGVDCHNFYPISLETVLFYKNAIENHYDKEVFE